MSALPPVATMKADIHKRSCPLCPRKQTYAVHTLRSALGHKRTLSGSETRSSLRVLYSFLFSNLAGLFLCVGFPLWCSAFLSSHPFCDPFLNTGSRCSAYASNRIGSFSGPCLY